MLLETYQSWYQCLILTMKILMAGLSCMKMVALQLTDRVKGPFYGQLCGQLSPVLGKFWPKTQLDPFWVHEDFSLGGC